jgi:hypothetical protein
LAFWIGVLEKLLLVNNFLVLMVAADRQCFDGLFDVLFDESSFNPRVQSVNKKLISSIVDESDRDQDMIHHKG